MSRTSSALLLICAVALLCPAQTPTAGPVAPQETVSVFTEEVLIPVSVTDEKGRFDPSLEKDELLVLEDGVPQEVTSARHVPASVLLLICTAGELNPAMKTTFARELAARLVSRLKTGDGIAVLQYGGDVETIQDWTTDEGAALRAIRSRLFSKRGARLASALLAAAARFEETPPGNRHLVLITDGVEESAESKARLEEAVRTLLAAGVIVHVLSYARMGKRAIRQITPPVQVTAQKPRKTAADIAREILNPNKPPYDRPQLHVTIDLDFGMRRRRAEYERAMREGEQWLGPLAVETGGALLLPRSAEEMLAGCESVARAIDSQYVVAYRPKRPLASADREEYRRVAVVARRIGLHVRTRRGYVVPPPSPVKR